MKRTATEYFNTFRSATDAVADDRYTSFDYCFNHFQSLREAGELDRLRSGDGLQTGCMQLGFYLASWGMYRGSSKLLGKSARYLMPMMRAVADAEPELWTIDVDSYSDENIARLIDFRGKVRQSFDHQISATLITKIMLGVFGNVPALDSYFYRGTGRNSFDEPTLQWVKSFYGADRAEVDELRPMTLDFETGDQASLHPCQGHRHDRILCGVAWGTRRHPREPDQWQLPGGAMLVTIWNELTSFAA